MQEYRDYIKRVTAIHHETVRRLADRDDTNLLELAEMFEDVANHYLSISEDIRAHFISEEVWTRFLAGRQSAATSSPTTYPRAEI